MESDEDTKPRYLLIIALSLGMAVIGTLIFVAEAVPKHFDPPEGAGEFGDMFGLANALFSGFAFLGVVVAILLQQQELRLQREELGHTREELRGQKEQLKLQNSTFKNQSFENAFFQMLSLHHQIVNALDVTSGKNVHSGRDCFPFFCQRLFRFARSNVYRLKNAQGNGSAHIDDEVINSHFVMEKLVKESYLEVYRENQADLGHYFRNLYTIIKFIDSSSMEDKKTYTNIVRAQLSTSELTMLFYNVISPNGSAKFKPLVEKYEILKNLPTGELLHHDNKKFIASSALGSTEQVSED